MKQKGYKTCEPTQQAEDEWQTHMMVEAEGTIWTSGCSGHGNWYTRFGKEQGEGKAHSLYFGSHSTLLREKEARKARYLVFQTQEAAAPAVATAST